MFRAADLISSFAGPIFQTALHGGQLEVREQDYPLFVLGDGNGPNFRMTVESPAVFQEILKDPDFNLGETYIDGKWDLSHGDLGQFLSWIVKNYYGWIKKMPGPEIRVNNPEMSKKNVAHHYDLGNDLYQCFLDEGMNYSCAFFNDHRMSLRDAQLNKIYTTLERAQISPGMKVLEIGCGWGELCRILARSIPDVEATGITLAEKQIEWAKEKNKTAGPNAPEFLLADYRDHARDNPGTYDRIISIGMFEHVGSKNYHEFFRSVQRLLKPGGIALVHSIMRAEPGGGTSSWIDSYIFPGGCIPYMPQALEIASQEGLEILRQPFIHDGSNYAETLRRWRQNFYIHSDRLSQERYDLRFRRIWDFYLAISEAGFDGFGNYVGQMVFKKPENA